MRQLTLYVTWNTECGSCCLLVTLQVNFLDLGRKQLTRGNEHKVLECLGLMKRLKHAEIWGLSKGAKDYLQYVMKLSKRFEEERKDFP